MSDIVSKIRRALKSPEKILLNIIYNVPLLKKMSDEKYISLLFRVTYGRKINLKNPETFNEKLNWLKLNDRKDIYTKMVDKNLAKEYVANIIGQEYIIPTIGTYNSFNEIDFNKLPEKFVMKCNHDSGNVIICTDKNKMDVKTIRKRMEKSFNKDFYLINREWPYKNIQRKIIVEKYMKDKNSDDLTDYKFYCFNGIPQYLYISEGLANHNSSRLDFFDMEFNKAPFGRRDYKHFDNNPKKPENFNKMIELSKELSKNIPFLRVDFYEINKKIYFSELTFSPCGGFMKFYPKEWDKKLGSMLNIKYKI